MKRIWLGGVALAVILAGCHDQDQVLVVAPVAPRDVIAPAAPRGLYSVTGDGRVTLYWLANTESDVTGYRVYQSPCSSGPSCPYDFLLATAGTSVQVTGLVNGTTRYFAVAAIDLAGNESDLSYEDVFDTPRPAGYGLQLGAVLPESTIAGIDFSAYGTTKFRLPWNDANTDIYHDVSGGIHYMFTAFTDTDIQDAGFASSLDAVDFAPDGGWSPDGIVQLIPGHNYVVWTYDNRFAKFRVVGLSENPSRVALDWAYQVDPGNPELTARKSRLEGPRVRRAVRPAS